MAFRQVSDHSIAHFQPPPPLHREHYFAGGGFQRLHQRVYAAPPPRPGYFYDDSNAYINMLPFQDFLDMHMNMITPTYHQLQNNYPTYSQAQRNYYFHQISVHDHFINIGPRGRSHDNRRHRVVHHEDQSIHNQRYNAEWMRHGYDHYVQDFTDFEDPYWIQEEEEAMIIDAIESTHSAGGLSEEAMIIDAIESTRSAGGLSEEAMIIDAIESTRSAGGLSEEAISKYLKMRICDKDKEGLEICIVCQDDLCQEDEMIGMLECGHNYHATCIKKWLQEKNVCPLCKSTALSID
ncbi:hypothetical protein BUALT_Bualt16G0072700 [Buddleja alternifolia]|uniref:RING-type E3 ubiquitin transferase n=1 Tax=Buddleja alternifolia TaxID=168488 RepID=A0AAV6WBB4_9LAMI|nr:hypothetical protein BUALT_Bualt16G0072700 [Buddleja alternifolia]